MKRIGLLSDTHGMLSPRVIRFFEGVDEIWHAGDIGSLQLLEQLQALKPLRAVYGNIDNKEIRQMCPEFQAFSCEELPVLITHIGGYPGKYEAAVRQKIQAQSPKLFISGHSHILKVMYDKKNQLLHINPGAAGNKGYHKVCTAVRFVVDGDRIEDLEILEFERTKFHSTN